MVMNFLHHLYQTKVDCSVVSSDGYSPQNLISSNWRERNQGFMAAHFIKPPVFLFFQFAFPIQIDNVVLKPKVGSQISTGIDILAAGVKPLGSDKLMKGRNTDSSDKTPSLQKPEEKPETRSTSNQQTNFKRRRIDLSSVTEDAAADNFTKAEKSQLISTHNYSVPITINSFKDEHRGLFSLVSRINEPQGRTLRIVNTRYSSSTNNCTCEDAIDVNFFHTQALDYVTHLVISVNRIKGSCVPSLGKLEIWGKPSASCGKNVIDYAMDVQKLINQHNMANLQEHATEKMTNISGDKDYCNGEEIPEDFIDPITCKVMTIPMLLPSGLNIDMTTLEKHTQAESQWGRMPSDPFTGVTFTNSIKPLPNSSLKARIDKYILSSGMDVSHLGRAVGRSCHDNKGESLCRSFSARVEHNPKNQAKIKGKLFNTNRVARQVAQQDVVHSSSVRDNQAIQVSQSNETHEERISNSLDNALTKTLQGATFIRKKPTTSTSLSCSSLVRNNGMTLNLLNSPTRVIRESRSCVNCELNLDTAFQLPCQHLICRKCLLVKCSSTKQAFCPVCQHTFHHKEVTRVHSL